MPRPRRPGAGRKPSPGSKKRKSRSQATVVVLPGGAMDPPELLDDVARAEWERVVPLLRARDLASPLFRAAVVVYCAAWSEYLRATADLAKEGRGHATKSGRTIVSAAWRRRLDAERSLHRASGELGLSPAMVAKVSTGKPKRREKTEDERLLEAIDGTA